MAIHDESAGTVNTFRHDQSRNVLLDAQNVTPPVAATVKAPKAAAKPRAPKTFTDVRVAVWRRRNGEQTAIAATVTEKEAPKEQDLTDWPIVPKAPRADAKDALSHWLTPKNATQPKVKSRPGFFSTGRAQLHGTGIRIFTPSHT